MDSLKTIWKNNLVFRIFFLLVLLGVIALIAYAAWNAASPAAPATEDANAVLNAVYTQAAGTALVRSTEYAQTQTARPPLPTDIPTADEDAAFMSSAQLTALVTQMSMPTAAETIQPTPALPVDTPTVLAPTQTLAAPVIPATTVPTAAASTPTSMPVAPTAGPVDTSCLPSNPPQTGTVLDVVDGDTLRIMVDGATYTVKLIGIDAPDLKAPFGPDARQKIASLLFGKKVNLIADATDKDPGGSWLRYVMLDTTLINDEMLRLGLASAVDLNPPAACASLFQAAQAQAQAARLGIWSR